MKYLRLAPWIGLIALAGCAGKPTTYLSLAPQSAPRTAFGAPGAPIAVAPIAVAHVSLPPSLDRLYLTSQIGPTRLHVARHARWAAPLNGLIQRTLADDLAARLTGVQLLMPGDPIPQSGVRLVRVNIDQFMRLAEGKVALTVDWSVVAPRQHAVMVHRTAILVSSGLRPTEQANAMSVALGRLADRIAQEFVRH